MSLFRIGTHEDGDVVCLTLNTMNRLHWHNHAQSHRSVGPRKVIRTRFVPTRPLFWLKFADREPARLVQTESTKLLVKNLANVGLPIV